jgi:hypothetical protein
MSEIKATPEMYARVFENMPEAAIILEDLVARFGSNPYTRGGLEGDRETCYKAGRNAVVHFILGKINQASGLDDPAAEDLTHDS